MSEGIDRLDKVPISTQTWRDDNVHATPSVHHKIGKRGDLYKKA